MRELDAGTIAAAVQSGDIDLGFSRIEPQPDVTYKIIAHEPIVVILPREHALASRAEIDPGDIDPLSFVGYSDAPHVLRGIVERYFEDRGLTMAPSHFLGGYATGISLVASTRGVTLPMSRPCSPRRWSVGPSPGTDQ